jgi:hypothetical protein
MRAPERQRQRQLLPADVVEEVRACTAQEQDPNVAGRCFMDRLGQIEDQLLAHAVLRRPVEHEPADRARTLKRTSDISCSLVVRSNGWGARRWPAVPCGRTEP